MWNLSASVCCSGGLGCSVDTFLPRLPHSYIPCSEAVSQNLRTCAMLPGLTQLNIAQAIQREEKVILPTGGAPILCYCRAIAFSRGGPPKYFIDVKVNQGRRS